jgi:hypothetical protein
LKVRIWKEINIFKLRSRRLRVFQKRVLRRIFGPKRDEDKGENYIMKNFITCTLSQVK